MVRHLRDGLAALFMAAIASFWVSSPASAAAPNNRLALVIGINDYNGLFDLKNAVNDVKLVEKTLLQSGFDVTAIYDSDRSTFEQALGQFAEKITPTSTVVFYYAGHGYQDNGLNYLLLRDRYQSVEDLDRSSHQLSAVYKTLRKAPTTTVMMFLDTCRTEFASLSTDSGVTLDDTRSLVRGKGIAQLSKGFAFFTGDINTFVSFSTQPGNVAQDGAQGNSPYTSSLVKHMKVAGIDLSNVMARTRKDVYDETKGAQTPWDHSSLTSTFEFRVCKPGEKITDGDCKPQPKAGPAVAGLPPASAPVAPSGPAIKRAAPSSTIKGGGDIRKRPSAPQASASRGGGGSRRGGGLPPDIGAGIGAGGI